MSNTIQSFQIAERYIVGPANEKLLISGPCQIESYQHCVMIANTLKLICKELGWNYVFKASFDKANRTSLQGKRGLGIEQGLEILASVRKECDIPILTDVHDIQQIEKASQIVDIIQIPAFLCRQTDLLIAAGRSNKVINIKKGQFLAPQDMKFVAEKVASTGNKQIMLCERGTCFGYRDLVVDMRGMLIMKEFGYPVVYDATHSVQIMGGDSSSAAGGSSGGAPQFIAPLARAALTLGINALFIECHDQPNKAPSDGANMLRLDQMHALLLSLNKIHTAIN